MHNIECAFTRNQLKKEGIFLIGDKFIFSPTSTFLKICYNCFKL